MRWIDFDVAHLTSHAKFSMFLILTVSTVFQRTDVEPCRPAAFADTLLTGFILPCPAVMAFFRSSSLVACTSRQSRGASSQPSCSLQLPHLAFRRCRDSSCMPCRRWLLWSITLVKASPATEIANITANKESFHRCALLLNAVLSFLLNCRNPICQSQCLQDFRRRFGDAHRSL